MEILNVGPEELLLILVIALIVLGPRDMVKTGQKVGQFIRKVIQSPAWHTMMNASREIREMPNRLIREAGLEEELHEFKQNTQIGLGLDGASLPNFLKNSQDLKSAIQQAGQTAPRGPDVAEASSGEPYSESETASVRPDYSSSNPHNSADSRM
jgi:Sec-independent protein translocase protein TatA